MTQANLLKFGELKIGQIFWGTCSCLKGAFIFSKISENEGKVTAVLKDKASPEYVGTVESFGPADEVLIPMCDVALYVHVH